MSTKTQFSIGFLGSMAITAAFLIFMYALTFPIESRDSFTYMALLGAIGAVLGFAMVGWRIGMFDLKGFTQTIFWSALSFALIWVVNRMIPFKLDVGPVDARLYAVLAGVTEELFFRVWLCSFTFKVTNSVWLSAGLSGGIWALYHISRYGGSMNTLLIVFVAGLIQGCILLYSRMADGPIFGHMLVNWIATS